MPLSATNNQFKQTAFKSTAGCSVPGCCLRNGYSGIIAASYNTSRRRTSSAEPCRKNSSVKSKVYTLYHVKVNKQYYFQRCIRSSLSHHGRVYLMDSSRIAEAKTTSHKAKQSHQSRSRSITVPSHIINIQTN